MVIKTEYRDILQCKKCGHTWRPYVKDPAACPECKTRYWKTGYVTRDNKEQSETINNTNDPIINKNSEEKIKVELSKPTEI